MDRFKQVNTRFGHLTGDYVLTEIATLLKGSIRGADAAIRYGGDEFLIALSNMPTNANAATVVDRIETSLIDWNRSSSLDDFTVSLSIGIAEWTDGKTMAAPWPSTSPTGTCTKKSSKPCATGLKRTRLRIRLQQSPPAATFQLRSS